MKDVDKHFIGLIINLKSLKRNFLCKLNEDSRALLNYYSAIKLTFDYNLTSNTSAFKFNLYECPPHKSAR